MKAVFFNRHKMENPNNDEQTLVWALEVLSSASPDVLFRLRDRIRKTMGQITRQLASVQNPSTVAFLDSLLKSSDKIATYLSQPVTELMKRTWTEEDPRITDMRKAKGTTTKEMYLRFFRRTTVSTGERSLGETKIRFNPNRQFDQ